MKRNDQILKIIATNGNISNFQALRNQLKIKRTVRHKITLKRNETLFNPR